MEMKMKIWACISKAFQNADLGSDYSLIYYNFTDRKS